MRNPLPIQLNGIDPLQGSHVLRNYRNSDVSFGELTTRLQRINGIWNNHGGISTRRISLFSRTESGEGKKFALLGKFQ